MSYNKYSVIGVMSGTSLDGLDLALCEFWKHNLEWKYNIIDCITISYDPYWKNKLEHAPHVLKEELDELDSSYGNFIAQTINEHLLINHRKTDLIASHGHTVFHMPHKKITRQIGDGNTIVSITGIPVVYNFRALDVEKGGQGAPLVPVGDKELFGRYDACLNLGGFSNISFDECGVRKAFDICPVNIILNYYAQKGGILFDNNGELGRKGSLNEILLNKLNAIEYYHQVPPKSLSREWLEENILSIIEGEKSSIHDIMHTLYEHIVCQIQRVVKKYKINSMLVTGGGALNTYLMERLKKHGNCEIYLPSPITIEFKEALVFAFLGLLRFLGEVNCYASVTGAVSDSVCGVLVYP